MTELATYEPAPAAIPIRMPRTRSQKITDIQLFVCAIWSVTHAEMLSPSRFAHVVRPRHVAIYLAERMVTDSVSIIGRRFNRDHSSIIHALRKMAAVLAADAALASELKGMQARIEGTWQNHGATQ